MSPPAARWHVDRLAAAAAPWLPPDRPLAIEVVAEIDSTNSELMRRVRGGTAAATPPACPMQPTLLVAERQTAGRGRLGRAWHSAQADDEPASLTFSLGLPLAPRDWSGLSLAVGVSVAESLDADGRAGLSLKWPNDLWVDDRKLGGILIETATPVGAVMVATRTAAEAEAAAVAVAPRWVVIGIGVNVAPRPGDGLATPPAWLRQSQPGAGPAGALLALLGPLLRDLATFVDGGFAAFAERFAARDALRGREVQASDGDSGWCEGVGPVGELLLRNAAGTRSITSSEVSVRPRAVAARA